MVWLPVAVRDPVVRSADFADGDLKMTGDLFGVGHREDDFSREAELAVAMRSARRVASTREVTLATPCPARSKAVP